MRHKILQSDDLPLPKVSEVLSRLEITRHAKERFKERTRAKEDLSLKILWRVEREADLTRVSPPWRKEGESAKDDPDFYLLFPIRWENGVLDQGCLIIKRTEHTRREDVYLAITFFSKESNNPDRYLHIPKPASKLITQIAAIDHSSKKEAEEKLARKPTDKKPDWIKSVESDLFWIEDNFWAISLNKEMIGSKSPYNYYWGQLFNRRQIEKEKRRKRYLKKKRYRKENDFY